jgi:hypothetical protein
MKKMMKSLMAAIGVAWVMTGSVFAADVDGVASVNGVTYLTLADAVAAANSGDTILLKAGEYELPFFADKELTFKGESKEGVIINDAPNEGAQDDWLGSTFHFENLTAKGATENNHGLGNGAVAVTYKDCIIKGLRFLYAHDVSFDGCQFDAEGVEHSFWTYGASNVTVSNCNFFYTDRAVNCYSNSGAEHELDIVFTNCTFTYTGTAEAPEGAVEINSGLVKSIELAMNDCTAPEKGAMWWNSQWDSKNGENTTVSVNGEPVWPLVVAKIGDSYYATLAEADAAAKAGDTITLIRDVTITEKLTIEKNLTIDANGKTLTITDSVVTITNGTLSAFTKDNVTLTGNAVLTVTDESVAASFLSDANYYVSDNANGTHSIMLKSAFRVFITMVDGEPRIGFFKDCSGSEPTYTLLCATNLENPDWQAVNYEDASDASGASELPLYWVKLDQAADDANVYRFFKIGPAPVNEQID